MTLIPKGIIIPVVTPTDANGNFSESVYRKLLRFWMANGVHGVFPFGTTGEFYAFSDDVFRHMLAVSIEETQGTMTVYAGANHITPEGVIRLARIAEEENAEALSVLTPMFVSQTQDELYDYFLRIAEYTSLPIVLYNNRPKTNVHIDPATVARLAEVPNIIGIKDSTGDMTNTEEYIRLTRHRNDFHVLMGRDTLIYAGLCYGCTGAITSCANFAPGIAVDIFENHISGNSAKALEAQFNLAALRIAANVGSFPVVIKEALRLIGYDAGECAAPVKPLSAEERQKLHALLKQIGIAEHGCMD